MTTATPPATRRQPIVNRLALAMLRTPTGHRLLPDLTALRFAGRRTKTMIVLPVSYTLAGPDVTVLVGRSGTKRWWRNFSGGHPVDVLLDGGWRTGVGEVVTADRLEYPGLLAAYRSRHRRAAAGSHDPIVHIRLAHTPVGSP